MDGWLHCWLVGELVGWLVSDGLFVCLVTDGAVVRMPYVQWCDIHSSLVLD